MRWRIALMVLLFAPGVPLVSYWLPTYLGSAASPYRPMSEWYLGLGYAAVAARQLQAARGPFGFVFKTTTLGALATGLLVSFVLLFRLDFTFDTAPQYVLTSLYVGAGLALLSIPGAFLVAIAASRGAGLPSAMSEWRWFWSSEP